MQAFLILVLAVLGLGTTPATDAVEPISQEAMTTYYFIRHAEKDATDPQNRNPELAAHGLERAAKWADIFREVPFELIYSTDYHRTQQTAAAIAKTKNLEVISYDPAKPADPAFMEATKGKTVLVVGHSNTIPGFVNALLKEVKYQDIDEAESGSLFIVTLSPAGDTGSQLLYIN